MYSDTNGTIAITENGDLYGIDQNGVYRLLTKTYAGNYKWVYTDDNGDEQTFTGSPFYYFSDVDNTNASNRRLTWTGLYGQSFAQNGYNWDDVSYYSWSDGSYTQTLLDAFNHSNDSTGLIYNLRCTGTSGSSLIYHYRQQLNGSYTRDDMEVAHGSGGNFSFSDKFTGFSVSTYSTGENGFSSSGGSFSATGSSGSYPLHIYHTRNSYDFTFDVNYPDAATVTFSNGRSSNLTLDPKVSYEAPLSNYGSTTTTDGNVTTTHWYYGIVGTENDVVNTADNTLIAPDHYIFGGWYEDATCTVPFNFDSTMPAANKIVYAKWTPEKFRIKIDPNGGEIDHVDHSSGGFSRPATYKSDGVTVERPADSGYNPSQSTYFNGTYGDLIGEYAVSRYYVPISNAAAASYTGNIYYYMNHQYTELDGNGINAIYRNALYLTDEDVHAYYTYYSQNGVTNLDEDIWRQLYVSTQKYRYVADGEVYKFLGWYQVFDEGTLNEHLGDMPYVFTTPISGPVTLRAVWRLDGGYTIRYHADYYMDDGTYINGTMPDNAWTDPMAGSAVLSYADGANTNIYKQPTNIMVNGNESDEYIFRGYILVNVTSSVND